MIDIHIEDFQNIKELDLTVDGFTTVVGESDIGKSSIKRAVKGLLENRSGEDFVRIPGGTDALVRIECPEITAEWRKGKNENSYVIDGTSYESVGRDVPQPLKDAGFREIEADRASLMPQVSDQFDPLFLLDEKGSVAAEILSDVGRLSDIQEALKQAKGDRREHEQNLRVREDDLEEAKDDLEDFVDLEDDMKQVEEAREYHDRIVEERTEIESLRNYREQKEELEDEIEALEGVGDLDVPEYEPDGLTDEIRTLVDLVQKRDAIRLELDRLKGVDDVDVPAAPEDDFETAKKLIGLKQTRDKLRTDINELRDVMGADVPSSDGFEDDVSSLSTVAGWIEDRDELVGEISDLKTELKELQQEHDEVKQHIDVLFDEAGKCPMCEQDFHS